jgi:hypothetical protein
VSAVDEIIQQIPLSQLASQLGVDEQTASVAVQQAIPALLGGMNANAQDPAGAASLEGAIRGHSPGLIDGGVDLSQVDPVDGQKIVGNVFGDRQEQVAQTLGGNLAGAGGQSELMRKLLPLLAPIVMSYLAKRLGGGSGGLLGSLLGGAMGQSGPGGLAEQLGEMLGGRPARHDEPQQAQASNPVLDMLGGLLGGGRR